MKAILIDSENETVTEVELSDTETLSHLYRLIKCKLVEVGLNLGNGNVIMVDEEGMMKRNSKSKFFTLYGIGHFFIGNGVIVGSDDDGEFKSHTANFDYITSKIYFP